jgi:AraC-like DNA-binding protein
VAQVDLGPLAASFAALFEAILAIHYYRIGYAQQLDFDDDADAALRLIHASGRGVRVRIPVGWISFLMPLSGRLELESQDAAWTLSQGDALLWREGPLRCAASAQCLWLSLCGPPEAWKQHVRAARYGAMPNLFPNESACPRAARRLLVRLACIAKGSPNKRDAMDVIADAFCDALIDSQADLQQRVQRCSGRTLRRRQQTLLRLLRVQLLIQHHQDGRLNLQRLAKTASYSPCHLVRVFREVFDETPSEYASRLRFDRAWKLVRETQMPICEITEALGFESQSAFCRAFKSTYGVTTTQARQLANLPVTRIPAAARSQAPRAA